MHTVLLDPAMGKCWIPGLWGGVAKMLPSYEAMHPAVGPSAQYTFQGAGVDYGRRDDDQTCFEECDGRTHWKSP